MPRERNSNAGGKNFHGLIAAQPEAEPSEAELLAEFAAMQGMTVDELQFEGDSSDFMPAHVSSKNSNKGAPPEINFDFAMPNFDDDDEEEMDVEALINDPDLQAEFLAMMGQPTPQPSPLPAEKRHHPNMIEMKNKVQDLAERYKDAALTAKKSGDIDTAKKNFGIFKELSVILENPLTPDVMKNLPPEPAVYQSPTKPEIVERQHSQPANEAAPGPPKSLEEWLTMMLTAYQTLANAAEKEGNNSKKKRNDRAVKEYQGALRKAKAGQPVDVGELPCPSGVQVWAEPSAQPPVPQSAALPTPVPIPQSVTMPNLEAAQRQTASQQPRELTKTEQLQVYADKLKHSALVAKQKGDKKTALEYLKKYKEIQAQLSGGKAVPPPSRKSGGTAVASSWTIVDADQTDEIATKAMSPEELCKFVRKTICDQAKAVLDQMKHYERMGDLISTEKFTKLAREAKQQLAVIDAHIARHKTSPPPPFAFEVRAISVLDMNPDLGANDFEIEIIRAFNLPLPDGYAAKDLDTYVKVVFPLPKDDPPTKQTDKISSTPDPVYNFSTKISVKTDSYSFKRAGTLSKKIFFSVFYKRGFLKSDKELGIASVPLTSLESSATFHRAIDLLSPGDNGSRSKPTGGKLEIRLRLREPVLNKNQTVAINQRWLVFRSAQG